MLTCCRGDSCYARPLTAMNIISLKLTIIMATPSTIPPSITLIINIPPNTTFVMAPPVLLYQQQPRGQRQEDRSTPAWAVAATAPVNTSCFPLINK
jgi:hypothetical protein